MGRFGMKLKDSASIAQIWAEDYRYTVTEIFELIYEYESLDLVYDAIQYAVREDMDDLKKACDILYKSQALRG